MIDVVDSLRVCTVMLSEECGIGMPSVGGLVHVCHSMQSPRVFSFTCLMVPVCFDASDLRLDKFFRPV